jgi:hypothetical protein
MGVHTAAEFLDEGFVWLACMMSMHADRAELASTVRSKLHEQLIQKLYLGSARIIPPWQYMEV